MWRACALLLSVAGCSQLFGLDSPTLDDAANNAVTGRLYVRYPHHDSALKTVIEEYAYPGLRAELRFADGVPIALPIGVNGTLEFQTHTFHEPYAVRFLRAPAPPVEVQHDASHFELVEYGSVRPDGERALPGTHLKYQLTDTVLGAIPIVNSTGQWMYVQPQQTIGYDVDWSTAYATGGAAPTLIQASQHDQVFFTLLTSTAGLQTIERYRVDDVEMMNGTTRQISGPTVALSRDQCVRLELPGAAEIARQNSAGYNNGARPVAGVYLQSSPALELPLFSAPIVASLTQDPPTDTALDVSYGDPFAGAPMLQYSLVRVISIPLPGGTTVNYTIGSLYVVAAQPGCAVPTRIVADIALPAQVTLDGVALETDGKAVTIDRTHPLELTWQRRGNGRSELTKVELYKLTPSGLTTAITFFTVTDKVRVDPTLIEQGGSYVFGIFEQTGYLNAGTGDFTFSLPHASSFYFTRPFTAAD